MFSKKIKHHVRSADVPPVTYTEELTDNFGRPTFSGNKNYNPSANQEICDKVNALESNQQEILKLYYKAKRGFDIDSFKTQNAEVCNKIPEKEQRQAATDVTNKILSEGSHVHDCVEAILKKLGDSAYNQDSPAEVHIVADIKLLEGDKPSDNKLDVAYQQILAQKVNEALEKHRSKPTVRMTCDENNYIQRVSNKQNKTFVGVLKRIFTQDRYDVSEKFKEGDLVWIADDHIQGGGTLLTRLAAFSEKGIETVGMSALSAIPETRDLKPAKHLVNDTPIKKDTFKALKFAAQQSPAENKWLTSSGDKLTDLKKSLGYVGIKLETLSNREALYLIAALVDPSMEFNIKKDGKPVTISAENWFKDIAQASGYDESWDQGKDSLMQQFKEEAMSCKKLKSQVEDNIDLTFKANIR